MHLLLSPLSIRAFKDPIFTSGEAATGFLLIRRVKIF